jgi:glucose-1-phosphate thymidylyltransferase
MLEANRLILEDLDPENEGETDVHSRIEGRVKIGRGSVVQNSVIRGPAVIGSNCRIVDSFVGPFTAIADNSQIQSTEIENSIVMGDCELIDAPSRLANCLIGRGASIRHQKGTPKSMQLVLGDSSSVILP